MLNRFVHYLLKVLLGVVVYLLSGFLFFLFNLKSFEGLTFFQFIKINVASLRFIFSAIVVFLLPYTLFYFLPVYRSEKNDKVIGDILFLSGIILSLLLNAIDWEYFKFTAKRTGPELFSTSGLGKDILRLLPRFLVDFWYVFIIVAVFVFLILKINNKINAKVYSKYVNENLFIRFALLILVIGLNILAYRGGTQLRPIKPITASLYAEPKYIPLILNTPFCLVRNSESELLEEKNYFKTKVELNNYFNPIKEFNGLRSLNKPNVVIIILESFSSEYMDYGGVFKGYTPFLDSLLKQSWFFPNAIANGKRSIEGIPAITAGVPTIMETPYISSPYASNVLDALPNKLKEMGYQTAFFHGGHNGTMGFDYFSKLAGFDKYYGYNEFNGPSTAKDGSWGIFDEPYLKYFAHKLSEFKQPFFASVFTLSSHHPFKLPQNFSYKGPLKPPHPILKTIYYTDWSLRMFFYYAKKQSWFSNTLFILTADHTGPDITPAYGSMAGIYKIPLAYFFPAKIKPRTDKRISQQIDIFPTVLDLCGYKGKAYCFGTNMADSTAKGFAINYILNTHQFFSDSLLFHFYNEEPLRLLNPFKDSLLRSNLLLDFPQRAREFELKTKAFIQTYHNDLINNKTYANKK